MIQNVFNKQDSDAFIARIQKLSPNTQALWGKMSVDKMLAHCNVTYEMVFENKHKAPNFLMKFILKSFIKPVVVGTKPYKKNSSTAPQFIIASEKDFEAEQKRLIDYISKVQSMGANTFEGKESVSFGTMNADEWNNMFAKHLDHHLSQFGV